MQVSLPASRRSVDFLKLLEYLFSCDYADVLLNSFGLSYLYIKIFIILWDFL